MNIQLLKNVQVVNDLKNIIFNYYIDPMHVELLNEISSNEEIEIPIGNNNKAPNWFLEFLQETKLIRYNAMQVGQGHPFQYRYVFKLPFYWKIGTRIIVNVEYVKNDIIDYEPPRNCKLLSLFFQYTTHVSCYMERSVAKIISSDIKNIAPHKYDEIILLLFLCYIIYHIYQLFV